MTRQIREASVAYVEHIIRDIQGELQAHVGMHADFDRVLLFGGGAALLKEGFPVKNIEMVVLKEPEFANARGFLSLARNCSAHCSVHDVLSVPKAVFIQKVGIAFNKKKTVSLKLVIFQSWKWPVRNSLLQLTLSHANLTREVGTDEEKVRNNHYVIGHRCNLFCSIHGKKVGF